MTTHTLTFTSDEIATIHAALTATLKSGGNSPQWELIGKIQNETGVESDYEHIAQLVESAICEQADAEGVDAQPILEALNLA